MKKAYTVQEDDEMTGGIVFATSGIAARRIGANRFHDGEFRGLICRRAPWADHCASDGIVPASLMIANGWWFDCAWSGQRIDEDFLAEKGWPVSGVVGTQGTLVFACKRYAQRFAAEKRQRHEAGQIVLAQLRDIILKRFPDAVILDRKCDQHWYGNKVNGHWLTEHAAVSFEFPGMKIGPASLKVREGYMMPTFLCCVGDREAFERWAASGTLQAAA